MVWKVQLLRPNLWDDFPSFWTQLDQQILAKLIHHFLQLYDELNLRLALHGSHKVQHKHKSKSTNQTQIQIQICMMSWIWGQFSEVPTKSRWSRRWRKRRFLLIIVWLQSLSYSLCHRFQRSTIACNSSKYRKLSICLISIWRSSELLVVSAFVCTVCIACISNTNSIKPSQGPYYNLFYCGLQHGWIFGKLISLSKSYIANFLFI